MRKLIKYSKKRNYNRLFIKQNQQPFLHLLSKDLMLSGQKLKARKLLFSLLQILKLKTNFNPLYILEKSLLLCIPKYFYKNINSSFLRLCIPIHLAQYKSLQLTIKEFLKFIKKQSKLNIIFHLATEILNILRKKSKFINFQKKSLYEILKNYKLIRYSLNKTIDLNSFLKNTLI